MAEGGTRADFERWAEPHLTALARFAGRRVAPAERDEVVRQSLIRAYQRWTSYDAARGTELAWLLDLVGRESDRRPVRRPARDVVELVDRVGPDPQTRDVDLERAVEGLGRRERLIVDLHHFVDLDLATVAEVARGTPSTTAATLRQAREHLRELVGDDGPEPMEQRLAAAARRWRDEQPPAPEVPVQRLNEHVRGPFPWHRALVAAAAVLVVGGSVVALRLADDGARDAGVPAAAGVSPTPRVDHAKKTVPFRDLEPRHPVFGLDPNGVTVTPYDDVAASGQISGTVHPGDTLVFDVALEAPGLLSLLPCPDYTITFGTLSTTRQLNCAEVPYFASLVRSSDKVTSFRPVLPAGVQVFFRMRVTVPDQPGRQTVLWTLDGPQETPGLDGVVDVTPQ